MTIVLLAMLVTPSASFTYNGDKKRVILIGIDGFSTDCIQNVPTIDWLRANGSWTYKARTIFQAVSGPGWSSILCSLDPIDTGIVDNDWVPEWMGGNPQIHSFSGKGPFKCIFENIKQQKQDLVTHYYYNWPFLKYFGMKSMGFVDQEIECNGDEQGYDYCDQALIKSTLFAIEQDSFDFMFVYIGNLDETGHRSGFCDAEYSAEMTKIDGYVSQIIKKLKDKNLLESTHIVLTTDHGASSHTKNHGKPDDQNILIPWIVYGPGIKKGYEIEARVHNLDTSPTVSALMGLSAHSSWVGRVVPGIFESAQEI